MEMKIKHVAIAASQILFVCLAKVIFETKQIERMIAIIINKI